jgi:hypothetical protein
MLPTIPEAPVCQDDGCLSALDALSELFPEAGPVRRFAHLRWAIAQAVVPRKGMGPGHGASDKDLARADSDVRRGNDRTDASRGSEGKSALCSGSTMRRAHSFPSLACDVQDENPGRPRAARHKHETRQYNLKRFLAASCAQGREQARKANDEGALNSAQGDATAWERCDSESTLSSAASMVIDTPKFGVVRSVPAPTLSCLQAVCSAAATPIVALGERIAGREQKPEANDTPALERTEFALCSLADTLNAHDTPDWDHRTALLGEPVGAGVRARMCLSSDSLPADKGLTVVANVERSACPHNNRLVLRRGDRSGDIIASLSLMPESLQLIQVSDQVVEMLPVAPRQSRSTPVVYLAFKNSARFERFRRMVGNTACPLV